MEDDGILKSKHRTSRRSQGCWYATSADTGNDVDATDGRPVSGLGHSDALWRHGRRRVPAATRQVCSARRQRGTANARVASGRRRRRSVGGGGGQTKARRLRFSTRARTLPRGGGGGGGGDCCCCCFYGGGP